MPPIIQVYREHDTHRRNFASWSGKRQPDGSYKMHFHADFTASTDWIGIDDDDVFDKIRIEMKAWIGKLDVHWSEMKVQCGEA